MSKELTKQWRNGTLEQRYYYVKYFGNGQKPFVEIELKNFLLDLVKVKDRDKIEVLAPVLSYTDLCELKQELEICKDDKADLYAKLCNALMQLESKNNQFVELTEKVERLEKQLEIATKALERINDLSSDNNGINDGGIIWCVSKALKEMEGVK